MKPPGRNSLLVAQAVLGGCGALSHPHFAEAVEDPSFDLRTLRATYARTFASLRRDKGLLQRAMGFLRVTGEVSARAHAHA